jgi:hypothetical protein
MNGDGMKDGVEQQTQRICKNMALLALELFARIIAMRSDSPPGSARLRHWLSMMAAVGRACPWPCPPALYVQRLRDAIQSAVAGPHVETVEKRTARRRVLRSRPPLAPRAQNRHDPVHHVAHIERALVAAALGWWDQRVDIRPCIVSQVTGVSQCPAVVSPAALRRPHP